jgi:hypothetical protein
MLELGIPNNRKFKENFEKYKQDTKNKDIRNERHIFKNNAKYMISSTMFFVLIVAVAIIGMYDLLIISKTFDYRIILYLGLTVYGMYGFLKIYTHKIIIENNNIIYKKQKIDILKIESAIVKIMKISSKKLDRCLVIKVDNKQYIYRLNLEDVYKFLQIIESYTKDKFIIEE